MVLLVAGCGAGEGKPAAEPVPSASGPDAKEEFRAALRRLQSAPYKFSVTGDVSASLRLTASGAHDPKARKLTRTVSLSGGRPGQSIVIGADSYSRVDGEGPWIHADLDELSSGVLFVKSDPVDPNGLARFTENVTLVERRGPHGYKGYFWLSEKSSFLPLGVPALDLYGPAGGDFTATTDAAGNVTSIDIAVEAKEVTAGLTARTFKSATKFTTHGQAVSIVKPQQVRALD
ncbi:hypothetical protein [Paractinoplanes atraurantiacus]|uniref:Lipoprotein LprG n=1 Tax=Paractinoplanes atraurantiacus TaxID=1036182 RepID=A0A285IWW6_9ACTN|nr:hypothetical protein [Actinoplanes atraurantiacus]SNY51586.1 hypothetical protein SAMN05421748_11220 [Actinoplanes atraurantiacus]